MLSLVRSTPISDLRIQTFQKTLHQMPPSSSAIRQCSDTKTFGTPDLSKDKKKAKGASNNCSKISGGICIIQGLCLRVNLLLNNLLNNCWIPVRNAFLFAFLFYFDRTGAPNFFYHCSMANDDRGS